MVQTPLSGVIQTNESLDEESGVLANALVSSQTKATLVTKTATGARWLGKYLHPPSVREAGYAGIPDRNAGPSVDYEWRLEDELPMSAVQAATADAQRILVISPPTPSAVRYVFAIDSSGALFQVPQLNTTNKYLNAVSFNANVESCRLGYLSDTYEQDASAINNAGMLAGCQFQANVTTFAASSLEALSRFAKHRGYKEMREVISSLLVTAAAKDEKLGETTPGLHIQVVSLGVVPTTLGDVTMRSPKSSTWRSTIGGYFPRRFSEPVSTFTSIGRGYTATSGTGSTISGAANVYVSYYEQYDPISETWGIAPFLVQGSTSPVLARDYCPWLKFTWSMLMYDFSSNNAAGVTGPAPLVHKKVIGFEACTPFGSMNQALQRQHAVLDTIALDIADTHASVCQDMLPAAANAGGFISAIAKWAPSVLSTLGSLFGAISKNSPNREDKINKRFDQLGAMLDVMASSPFMEQVKKTAKKQKPAAKANAAAALH